MKLSIIVLTFSALVLRSASAAPECSKVIQIAGFDITPGVNEATYRGVQSAEECAAKCIGQSPCFGSVYNTKYKACYTKAKGLWAKSVASKGLEDHLIALSCRGIKRPAPARRPTPAPVPAPAPVPVVVKVPVSECEMARLPGYDVDKMLWIGETPDVKSEKDCFDICRRDLRCNSAVYTSNRFCYKKRSDATKRFGDGKLDRFVLLYCKDQVNVPPAPAPMPAAVPAPVPPAPTPEPLARAPAPTPAPRQRPQRVIPSNVAGDGGGPSNVAADSGGPGAGGCSDDWIQRAVRSGNVLRSENSVGALSCDDALSLEAKKYSAVLCRLGDLTHDGYFDRCKAAGYGRLCAENLLWNTQDGPTAPEVALQQWEDSPGHFENLIYPTVEVVGYGYHVCGERVYWTGLYSKRN